MDQWKELLADVDDDYLIGISRSEERSCRERVYVSV